MKVIQEKIENIIEYDNNPRDNAEAVGKVAESIENFGFRVPIVVDEDMVVLAGHTRLKAGKLLGLKKVPVHIAEGLSEAKKKAFRIADNKSGEFANWNDALLSKEFQALAEMDIDLSETAFDYTSIEKLTSDVLEFEPPQNQDIVEENIDLSDIQQSNIRMVNLFLNTESEPTFRMMCEALQENWQTENITETTYEAVKKAYENIQP